MEISTDLNRLLKIIIGLMICLLFIEPLITHLADTYTSGMTNTLMKLVPEITCLGCVFKLIIFSERESKYFE